MGLTSNELAQITARVGVARLGTARLGAIGKDYQLKANGTGEFIWNRPVEKDGHPATTVAGWAGDEEPA